MDYTPDESTYDSTSNSDDTASVIKKQLTMHGRKPKTGAVPRYKCKYCAIILTSKTALLSHLGQHEGINFICPDCGKTLKSQHSFDNHVRCHVVGPKCHIGKQKFELRGTLYNYMKKHDKRYFMCTVLATCLTEPPP